MLAASPCFCPATGAWAAASTANTIIAAARQVTRFMNRLLSLMRGPWEACTRGCQHHRYSLCRRVAPLSVRTQDARFPTVIRDAIRFGRIPALDQVL